MLKLLIVLAVFAVLASSSWGAESAKPAAKPPAKPVKAAKGADEPAGPHKLVVSAVSGATNKLKRFKPKVASRKERQNRHVPMIFGSSPWSRGSIPVEVPECIHGRYEGDRRKGFLFWGRALKISERMGGVRYPSLEPPIWKKIPGGIAMDNPLEDGLTVHFRVIGHDRMMEIRWGMTNTGDKTIRGIRAQICAKSPREPSLADRHVLTSRMLSKGKLISWDAAGQDLKWLDKERAPDGVRFKRSCFFIADVTDGPVKGRLTKQPLFALGQGIDLPAIAKIGADERQAVIVYSPSAKKAFYNVLQPCFHANPFLPDLKPGQTHWTQTYVIYFEGDLEAFMNKLSAAHKKIIAAKEADKARSEKK